MGIFLCFFFFSLFPFFTISYVTNDPFFDKQFNVNKPGPDIFQFFKDSESDINVKPVWESGIFGDGVVVSVVGFRCNTDHEDLNHAKYLETHSLNIDSLTNFTTEIPWKAKSLSTAALGIIVAEKNNGKGIHGIAPNANYFCIQQSDLENNDKIAHAIGVNNMYTDVKLLTIPRRSGASINKTISSQPHKGIDTGIESNPKTICGMCAARSTYF